MKAKLGIILLVVIVLGGGALFLYYLRWEANSKLISLQNELRFAEDGLKVATRKFQEGKGPGVLIQHDNTKEIVEHVKAIRLALRVTRFRMTDVANSWWISKSDVESFYRTVEDLEKKCDSLLQETK